MQRNGTRQAGSPSGRSISRRLGLMFALVTLCMFTLIGTGLFFVLRCQLQGHLRESLDDRMQIAGITAFHASTPEKWLVASEKLSDMTPRDGTWRFAAWSTDPAFHYGQPVEGSVVDRWPGGYARVRLPNGEPDMLVRTQVVPPRGTRPVVQLQAAESYLASERTLGVFGFAVAAMSGLGSLIVLWLSYGVTRLGLAPLTRLTREASEVRPDNRSQRLDTTSLPRELDELAHSFNGALERLDVAYGRLESFNADVAHELRTPVTILIGETQVALTRSDRSIDDLRLTLQSNLEEYERIRGIINDMLFLARADQGEQAGGLVEVSLAAEVARTLEFLEIPLDEAQVHAVSHGDATALVNRSMFGRACTNLLMNAIQHCAPGDTIDVSIEREAGHVRISVANPGEPIAPAVLDHLFARFYRAEASRTNSRENHGLGLAIVKAIAEMHRGTVSVRCDAGVNAFTFSVAAPDDGGRPGHVDGAAAAFSQAPAKPAMAIDGPPVTQRG